MAYYDRRGYAQYKLAEARVWARRYNLATLKDLVVFGIFYRAMLHRVYASSFADILADCRGPSPAP
jgi:hypothetical protein